MAREQIESIEEKVTVSSLHGAVNHSRQQQVQCTTVKEFLVKANEIINLKFLFVKCSTLETKTNYFTNLKFFLLVMYTLKTNRLSIDKVKNCYIFIKNKKLKN